MKVKIKLTDKTIERKHSQIERLILDGRLPLKGISQKQRISNRTFYIYAFRATRGLKTPKKYIECLQILKDDISTINDERQRDALTRLLVDYIMFSPYDDNQLFVDYAKTIVPSYAETKARISLYKK